MDFSDLNLTERAALVALLRTSAIVDGSVSDNEESAFGMLARTLGEDGYAEAAAVATERVSDKPSLHALLSEVERPEARELIYGTLLQMAASETITNEEAELLELLEGLWNITPQFEDVPS